MLFLSKHAHQLPLLTPLCGTAPFSPTQLVMDANRNPRNFEPSVVTEALVPLCECPSFNTLQLVWRTWWVWLGTKVRARGALIGRIGWDSGRDGRHRSSLS